MSPIILLPLLFVVFFVGLTAVFVGAHRLARWKFARQFPFEVGSSLSDSALTWAKSQSQTEESDPPTEG
jgi:hypothetical protein